MDTTIFSKITGSALILTALASPFARADVYPDTLERRRDPTAEEKRHLLHLGKWGQPGCSASALTPDTIITAEHCFGRGPSDSVSDLELINGYFDFDPSQTFQIVTVIDQKTKKKNPLILDVVTHYSNDILILKIKWTQKKAPTTLLYPREIATSEADLVYGTDDVGSPLFALGYPHDLARKPTYSSGFLRERELIKGSTSLPDPYTGKSLQDAVYLKVNVALSGGNSGGPVYTTNYKLVGTVHGGTGQCDGEKNNLPECSSQNSRFWNRVASIAYLYSKLPTLQKLFPGGINPNVNEQGEWIGPQ